MQEFTCPMTGCAVNFFVNTITATPIAATSEHGIEEIMCDVRNRPISCIPAECCYKQMAR